MTNKYLNRIISFIGLMLVLKFFIAEFSPLYGNSYLHKNNIKYKAIKVELVQPTDLVTFHIDQFAVSPFLCLTKDIDGSRTISISLPQQKIAFLFDRAVQELQIDNYKEVKNLYQQAYNLDSLYFKTASNLGDAWGFLGEYRKAEYYLEKAIKLNNAGYQEHLFLADVYDKREKNREAVDAITYAFMLNKNNPYLLQCLRKILEKNKLYIKEDRLEFPFNIKKTGVRECEIKYANLNGINWEPMANCLARWKMEPELQMQLNGDDMFTSKVKMYRECFFEQQCYLKKRKRTGKKLTLKEEEFLAKIEFVNAIIYWEIIAGEEPLFMFYLPDEERDLVVKYIKKFVYQRKTFKKEIR